MEKFKNLEIKKLISEYNFLLDEEEWKNLIIEENKSDFLNAINSGERKEENKDTKESSEIKKDKKEFELDEETKKRIKKIYYKIASISHPDKVSDPNLNEIYQRAAKYYEENNILEIYRIANELKIPFDIDKTEIDKMKSIIDEKKKFLKSLEGSWLWLWVNAHTDEEKENIVKMFLEYSNKNI
jgi:hypothetical protein